MFKFDGAFILLQVRRLGGMNRQPTDQPPMRIGLRGAQAEPNDAKEGGMRLEASVCRCTESEPSLMPLMTAPAAADTRPPSLLTSSIAASVEARDSPILPTVGGAVVMRRVRACRLAVAV